MIPDDRVELLVARFSYVSHVNPQYPQITLIRKKHAPTGLMNIVRDWFDRAVSAEKAQLPPTAKVKFAEYSITSGDAELFKVDGCRFDKILLLLGEEYTHWNFYQQNMPLQSQIVGKATLPISFCVCCFHTQYAQIMKTLKNSGNYLYKVSL